MAGDSSMQTVTFVVAFVAVLALILVAGWLLRRFGTSRLGANANRGRMPRLAVIDAAAVDGRRRLVLVRRDNIEHLLMIGGPTDIVVEPNIVRAMPGRDQMSARPAVAPDAAPPRVAPLPDAAWNESEAARTETFDEPELPPRPPRPAFADEVRRAAERRPDPLAGLTPEPVGARPERTEPRPDPMPPRLPPRNEPLIPRPPRAAEPPKMPPPLRTSERAAAPPPPPPPAPAATAPTPPPPASNADANLAEMAQRLEAALRRPSGGGEAVAPPVAPEAPPLRPVRSEPAAPPAQPAPQKTGFENLEDEMASLLGRPKTPS